MKLEISTPSKLEFSDNVAMATIPGEDGDFGILDFHSSTISNLKAGIIEIFETFEAGSTPSKKIFVEGGLAEANSEGCSVLATKTIDLETVKKSDIEKNIQEAKDSLDKAESDFDKKIAQDKIQFNETILSLI